MKKLLLIIPIALIALTSFYFLKPVSKINIQPLGEVSPQYINLVKKSVKSFYGYDCVVLPKKEITKDMLSPIKKRVDAKKGANGVWIGPFDKVEYARAYYVMKFNVPLNECNCVNH